MSTFSRRLFRFLASLKLAIILMVVIILAVTVGTVLESWYNPEVARAYVYSAVWFNLWLSLLAVNLFCVAAIRYPWKSHQTGFVITHAGMIMVLIGGLIDRRWGFEGYVELRRGEPSTNNMQMHESELLIRKVGGDSMHSTPFNMKHFPAAWNSPFKPDTLLFGWNPVFTANTPEPEYTIKVTSTTAIQEELFADESPTGKPAITIGFKVPGAEAKGVGLIEQCIFLNQSITLAGRATLIFKKGPPPMVPSRERQFQFAKHPDKFPSRLLAGERSGALSRLVLENDQPFLDFQFKGKKFRFNVKENLNREVSFDGFPDYKLSIKNYFNNLQVSSDNQVYDKEGPPENPGVLYEIVGPLAIDAPIMEDDSEDPHGESAPNPKNNLLTFYLLEGNKFLYHMKSKTKGQSSGEIALGSEFEAVWMVGAKIKLLNFVESGVPNYRWKILPLDPSSQAFRRSGQGLRCEILDKNGQKQGEVIAGPDDSQIKRNTAQLGNATYEFFYRPQHKPLPFHIGLLKFHAPEQEGMIGSGQFEAFESTLYFENKQDEIEIREGSSKLNDTELKKYLSGKKLSGAIVEENADGIKFEFTNRVAVVIPHDDIAQVTRNSAKIHMNHPTTYPRSLAGPFLGTTYKFSQASHRMPQDPDYSAVQVLWDPGWLPKWVGCLGIVFGIFTMFYLKPYFRGRREYLQAEAQRKAADAATDVRTTPSATPSGVGMGKE